MKLLESIACLIYNFALLAGATFLVVNYNWSMWVYLLVVLFMVKQTKD